MVPNVVKNATQNRYGFWVRFLIPFGSILSPFWDLKVGGCRSNFHLKWSLCSLRWSLASLGCHFGVLFDKSGRCSPIFIKNNGIYTSIFLFWFLYVPLFVCSSVFLFEHIGIDHLHASDQHRGTCDQKVTKFEDCIGYLVMQTAHHGVDPVIVKITYLHAFVKAITNLMWSENLTSHNQKYISACYRENNPNLNMA